MLPAGRAVHRRELAPFAALCLDAIEPRRADQLSEAPPRRPSPTWGTFVRTHLAGTIAIDFLTVPTATFDILYVFFVPSLERRRVLHVNVTAPYAADGTPIQLWTCNGTSAQIFRAQWSDTSTADGGTPPSWVDMTNNPFACDDKNGVACGWSSSNSGEGYTCGRRHPDWASPWTCEK